MLRGPTKGGRAAVLALGAWVLALGPGPLAAPVRSAVSPVAPVFPVSFGEPRQGAPSPGLDPADPGDDPVRESARVELVAPDSVYVGQRVELSLRIGLTQALLENLVPLSRRPLDLPIEVQAPWLEPGSDPRVESVPLDGTETSTLALAGRLAHGRPIAAEASAGWRWYEVPLEWAPEQPGRVVLEGAELTLAHATRFRDDLLQGRVPEDRREARVQGPPRDIEVRPLPEAGRPLGFTGAVGTFTVAAQREPGEVHLGEGVAVALTILGTSGGSGAFGPPSLERVPGFEEFALRGWLERPSEGGRTFVFDVAPRSTDVTEIPAIPFAYFQPTAPVGWRVARTAPLPLRVLPAVEAPEPAPSEGGDSPEPGDAAGGPDEGTGETGPPGWVVGLILAGVLTGATFALVRGRARSRRTSPAPGEPGGKPS